MSENLFNHIKNLRTEPIDVTEYPERVRLFGEVNGRTLSIRPDTGNESISPMFRCRELTQLKISYSEAKCCELILSNIRRYVRSYRLNRRNLNLGIEKDEKVLDIMINSSLMVYDIRGPILLKVVIKESYK